MQTVARHDVGLAAEDLGRPFLDVHQAEQARLAALVIEEQIDVGIRARVATRNRAEQIQMLDAERFQLGFVLPQSFAAAAPLSSTVIQ